eukprot:SAG25_NODE_57_length_18482_cov_39.198063_8_plen_310_part_00
MIRGGTGVVATLGLLLLLCAASRCVTALDPRFSANITLYHEYQPKYESLGLGKSQRGCVTQGVGVASVLGSLRVAAERCVMRVAANQDTGNVRGDSYFVLRSLILPVECASKGPKYDCQNPEANSTQNVVSRHTVTVDTRYGTYASCTVGRDGYQCAGSGTSVGRCDVKARELSHGQPRYGAEPWQWWRLNLAVKMGSPEPAYWYSTVAGGDCDAPGAGPACSWKLVATTRKIVAQCLETRITEALRRQDPACFAGCAQPLNASSACVVQCYMGAILGPAGGSVSCLPGAPHEPQRAALSVLFSLSFPD